MCYLRWPLPGTPAYLGDPLGFKVAGGVGKGTDISINVVVLPFPLLNLQARKRSKFHAE